MIELEHWEKDFLFFYDWLMFNKSQGDNSYMDFYYFIKVSEGIINRTGFNIKNTHNRTTKRNVATNYMCACLDLDIEAYRNNIFTDSDIKVSRNKWSLRHDMR